MPPANIGGNDDGPKVDGQNFQLNRAPQQLQSVQQPTQQLPTQQMMGGEKQQNEIALPPSSFVTLNQSADKQQEQKIQPPQMNQGQNGGLPYV